MAVELSARHWWGDWVDAARRDAEVKSLVALWTHAASTLDIRYPDPNVYVNVDVKCYEPPKLVVDFQIFNLRDTTNLGWKVKDSGGFVMPSYPQGWPGLKPAQLYLAAIWTIYFMHEAQELVTYKDSKADWNRYRVYENGTLVNRFCVRPVIDAHDNSAVNQVLIGSSYDIARIIDFALGTGRGRQMIDAYRDEAQSQFANEIAFHLGQVARED